MAEIRDYVRNKRSQEVNDSLEDIINNLGEEGLQVEFGHIGKKTTYALIYSEDHNTEYVGYTFVRNMNYYNESVGKLKAINQAIARKETLVSGR